MKRHIECNENLEIGKHRSRTHVVDSSLNQARPRTICHPQAHLQTEIRTLLLLFESLLIIAVMGQQ